MQASELKSDQALFACLHISARFRTDMDLKQALQEYEFSMNPWALSATTEKLLPCTDKSKLLPLLETLVHDVSRINKCDDITPGKKSYA